MATASFVVSGGQLVALDRASVPATAAVRLADRVTFSYADIYRTQPHVRTVIGFLARNIAQIGIHVFQRVSDTDRKRLADHPLAQLLGRPNPRTTRYRLIDALVNDLGIFDVAFWLKAKGEDSTQPRALLRIRPDMVTPQGDNWLWPDKFRVKGARGYTDFDADQVVFFRGYNPTDNRWGLSPMETLRQVLAEEWEAGRWREQLWRNGARFPGHIRRPKDTAWAPGAAERFKADWRGLYTGDGPGAGGTPVLEDGMEFHPNGITPQQAQYLETRKLTREEVAAAFHIPLPMVGILDHATFSNIEEQHKNLYQDTLGPWLTMISEEIELQLLPDLDSSPGIYVEFNLAEKMQGDFATEAGALQGAVGGPFMTPNEARARRNLPSVDGGDELYRPLNLDVGAGAPADQPAGEDPAAPKGRRVRVKAAAADSDRDALAAAVRAFFARQKRGVMGALGSKAAGDWWDGEKWDADLAAVLYEQALAIATKIGQAVAADLGFTPGDYDPERTQAFLEAVAESRAGAINETTRKQVQAALDAPEDDGITPADVFKAAASGRALQIAQTVATTVSSFGTVEAAKQVAPGKATKTWRTRSGSPRKAHARMDGETVGINEKFSNRAEWPGDPVLGDDGVAGCKCDVEINIP